MNYQQLYAKKKNAEKRILAIRSDLDNSSGIYFFYREENGIKSGYVGQAKQLLRRCADHLLGFQHIDNSIKKHGLYDELKNPNGYKLWFIRYDENELDERERYYIKCFSNAGYQLKNKTIGGQDSGKVGLGEQKAPKGYREGLQQGYKNCHKEIKVLFEKYLVAEINGQPNKIKQRKLADFRAWLEREEQ